MASERMQPAIRSAAGASVGHRLGDVADGRWDPEKALDPQLRARFAKLAATLSRRAPGSERPVRLFYVPGRIEVLGKHTDYAGGRGLVVATRQGVGLVASPRADSTLRIFDLARGSEVEVVIDPRAGVPAPDWTVYPRTVASRLAADFGPDLRGLDIVFDSDLPSAAGLSSSSSLVVAFYLAMAAANARILEAGWTDLQSGQRQRLAAYLGAVESGRASRQFAGGEGVGTRGGNQDHTAILCSAPQRVRQFGYRPTRLERSLPVPADWVFAVGVSGVQAQKTGPAGWQYNSLADLAARLETLAGSAGGNAEATLAESVDGRYEAMMTHIEKSDLNRLDKHRLQSRLTHFWRESFGIVPAAAEALAAGDLDGFGARCEESMHLATELLDNQVPETIWLAAAARRQGASASSAFGAGFGGAVWALVRRAQVERFLAGWSASYVERFANRAGARFFWTEAAGPAAEL